MPEISIASSPYPAMLLASGIATMLEQAGASVTIHLSNSSLRLVASDTQRLPPAKPHLFAEELAQLGLN